MDHSSPVRRLWSDKEEEAANRLISLAFAEDTGSMGDLTSQSLFDEKLSGKAQVIARSPGVIAGIPLISKVMQTHEKLIEVRNLISDGSRVDKDMIIAEISGPFRGILTAERTMLNFLQRLSGVASLTAKYVEQLKGINCKLLDTRKTTPGWRVLEKYAVRCGGGHNHRMGLYDGVMIKDNHLGGLRQDRRSIRAALELVRQKVPANCMIEVEVDSLSLLQEAMQSGAKLILLDNMSNPMLIEAVRMRDQFDKSIQLEASGGVTLATIREIAFTGVDRISVGAITHSAPALDIALDYYS